MTPDAQTPNSAEETEDPARGKKTGLFSLPPETRERIYGFLGLEDSGVDNGIIAPRLVRPWPCPSKPHRGAKECTQPKAPRVPLTLFRVNKAIKAEISNLSYRRWSLKVATTLCDCPRRTLDGPTPTPHQRTIVELRRLLGWMRHIGPQNRQWLRFLTLDIPYRNYYRYNEEARDEFVGLLEQIGALLAAGASCKVLVVKGVLGDDRLGRSSAAELAMEALGRTLWNARHVIFNEVDLSDKEAAQKAVDDRVIPATVLAAAQPMFPEETTQKSSESGTPDASAAGTSTDDADAAAKKTSAETANSTSEAPSTAAATASGDRSQDAPGDTAAELDAKLGREARVDHDARRAGKTAKAKAAKLFPAPLNTLPLLWQEGAKRPCDTVHRTQGTHEYKPLMEAFLELRSHPDLRQQVRDDMDMYLSRWENEKRVARGKRARTNVAYEPGRAQDRRDKYAALEKRVYDKAMELPW